MALLTQEIPPKFTKRTGWPGAGDCNLITAKRNSKSWPVTFQQSSSSSGTVAWSSYGGGYGQFLTDNEIALPTLLVLEQVDDRTLVVVIHRDETSPPKKVLPPPKFEEDPWWQFQKTLRACHTRPSKSTRLVSELRPSLVLRMLSSISQTRASSTAMWCHPVGCWFPISRRTFPRLTGAQSETRSSMGRGTRCRGPWRR